VIHAPAEWLEGCKNYEICLAAHGIKIILSKAKRMRRNSVIRTSIHVCLPEERRDGMKKEERAGG